MRAEGSPDRVLVASVIASGRISPAATASANQAANFFSGSVSTVSSASSGGSALAAPRATSGHCRPCPRARARGRSPKHRQPPVAPGPRAHPSRCWPVPPVGDQRARASSAPPSYYPVAVSVIPPSGQQFALTTGDQRAVVTEVGAGLRTYAAGDRDVVDGFPEDEMATIGRGQVLLPGPNRIEEGQYEFAGRMHQTSISEPARHNALHGLTRWVNWTAVEQAKDRVLMSLVLHPQGGAR